MIPFPVIPAPMLDVSDLVEPCPEVRDWARAMFISAGAERENLAHQHLRRARVEFIWTNVAYEKAFGVRILGTAELGKPAGNAWIQARKAEQLGRWFHFIPDFLITLDVVYLSTATENQICALIEHELYHCAHALDDEGDPKYSPEGDPVWAMKPHDVEQFVGVMARYGASYPMEEELVKAIQAGPIYGNVDLRGRCGSCK